MKRIALTALALLAFAPACDAEEKCEPLANHIVELVKASQPDATPEAVEKAKKDTMAACAQEVPKPEVLACALAAKDLDALKACDPVEEEKKE